MNKIISTPRLCLFLTLICIFTACKDTNSRQTATNTQQDSVVIEANIPESKPKTVTLYAWVDRLRVRADADKKASIVAEVMEGTPLTFLDEKSDFTEKINLRGTLFDEPWLKVKTEDGKIGWVYGGGVKFYAPKIDAAPSPYDHCMPLRVENQWGKYRACMDLTAQKQLTINQRWVQDKDDKLTIRLLDGSTKTFVDQSPSMEEDGFEYSYSHYLPKMGFHVLFLVGYESSAYLLVNDKSGSTQKLFGYPKASPDNKHLVVTNLDVEAGFEVNGISLWGYTEDGFKEIFRKELDVYGPATPIWLDENTVEMTMIPYSELEGAKRKLAHLRLGEQGTWKLEYKD